jgi:hypothetical protein
MASYLVRSRHGTTFHVRFVVPQALRPVLGLTEIKRSLGTSDKKLARARAAEFVSKLTTAMANMKKTKETPTFHAFVESITKSPDGTINVQGIKTRILPKPVS